jgi:peptidoglycan/LPS O-acetylase OafA/YrhL
MNGSQVPEPARGHGRQERTVFPAIDVLRGIAALLVPGYHVV